jgi:ATP-dependent helicase/nuclease subunit B
VALLTAKLASGRRWRRLYLMHAVAGAYKAGEDEDYFTPEEARLGLEAAYTLPKGLPKRYAGRDSLFFGELKSRAGEVVISYPEADQGGPLVPERELIGETTCLPRVPPGSRLELQSDRVYQAAMGAVSLGSAHVEGLRAYSECAFRYWARRRVRADEEAPWWRALVAELRALERLSEARLEALGARYPQAESWLLEHQDKLMALHFGLRLPRSGAPQARIDAAARERGQVALYLFAEPKSVRDGGEAKRLLENRWAEWWAAGYLLRNWPQRVGSVRLSVWPLLGAPVAADGEIVHLSARLTACEHKVSEAHARFIQGDVSPSPGFICRDCEVRDICRVARS